MRDMISNPILPGFHADPSIARVGDDYYLVCSSFCFFPGLPIYHSRDLAHWELIAHAIDRPSQLTIPDGEEQSRGLFAPTIRHHEGTFYILNTNVSFGNNFAISAKDPRGPWSEPMWIESAEGIDPSIYFDDNGRAWYVGTRPAPEGVRHNGNWEIWLSEIDIGTMKLKGEKTGLWRGAMRDVIWPEGPHIFKREGWYYILHAEGGTSRQHAVCMARSRDIRGPYEGNPNNPILTHRHFGKDYPVVNVGHADLVETPQGESWLVMLASRPLEGYCLLGRECFIAPALWEDDWLVASPGTGMLEPSYPAPRGATGRATRRQAVAGRFRDDFDKQELDLGWYQIRTPKDAPAFSLSYRPGYLGLSLLPASLRDRAYSASLLRILTRTEYEISTRFEFTPEREGEWAGLVAIQNDSFQFRLEIGMAGGRRLARAVQCEAGVERVLGEAELHGKKGARMGLKIVARGLDYAFFYKTPRGSWRALARGADGRILSTEKAAGFIGAFIGIFATSSGRASTNVADFDYFEYR